MISDSELKEILLDRGFVSAENLERATRLQKEQGHELVKVLTAEGFLEEDSLLSALSEYFAVPMLRLSLLKIEKEVLRLLPQRIMKRHEAIPISKIGKNLTVAFSDPLNIIALDDIKTITGLEVIPVLATANEIQKEIEKYLTEDKDLDEMLEDIEGDESEGLEFITDHGLQAAEGEGEEGEDAPVIKLVNLVLNEALKKRASDIHFEAFEKKFRVRLRIDGVLTEIYAPPLSMHGSVIARIKIMSELDITERRVPQDGRFKIRLNKKEIDFRVSILPCIFGEKAVLRILDKSNLQVGLDKLGYLPETLKTFKEAIKKPYGLILVTGPTGSGKSTTLYSVLNIMNTPDRNIMTVEDPIEYQVQGITQTQVKHEIGLTFASGLRSLLRQSPDVILVGEIRDGETADIAVKSALTGHLVFSTLHTNSACGAITRLIDMGVEPFLISSSVVMVAAQRLARKICENCKEEYEVSDQVLNRLGVKRSELKNITAYHGAGCNVCNQTGYYGRLGTIECLVLTDDIRKLILQRASSEDIEKLAIKNGMKLLYDNLFTKFKMGLTTLEEVLRISSNE